MVERAFTRIDPLRLASQFLNGLIGAPAGPGVGVARPTITANQLSLTGFGVNRFSFGTQSTPSIWSGQGANVEISVNISGGVYQTLLNGMLAKAAINGPVSVPTDVSQVDPNGIYSVQLGLTAGISFNSDLLGQPELGWQGAFQIFDAVTGSGSLGYGWKGNALTRLGPNGQTSLISQLVEGQLSAANSDFVQPSSVGTFGQVPQQQVAAVFVQNYVGETPINTWPMSNATGGVFDPIVGAKSPFQPTNFGI